MATIALQAIGSYYGGPVGGAIGAAIGGYIDSNYLLPALFPSKDQQGNRVDSIQLSYYSEGAPFPRGFGALVKNEGICGWLAGIRDTPKTTSQGKGGGGPTTTTTEYKTDFAIFFCETSLLPGGRINGSPEKIWFDGKLVYDAQPDVNLASSLIEAIVLIETLQVDGLDLDVQRLLLRTTIGGPDFIELQPGRDADVAGFTAGAAVNNGTWRVLRSNGAVGGGTEVLFGTTVAVAKAAGDPVTVFQNLPEFDPAFAASFTFYDGSQLTPDPTIVASEGAGLVPNYKQLAFVVVSDVDLTSSQGRPPNAFSILYSPDADGSIAQAIRLLMLSAGLIEGQNFDVSGVSGNLKGFVQRGPQTPASGIEQIMVAYDVQAQDRDGILTFYNHADVDLIIVADGDLAAHEQGSSDEHRNVQVRDDRYRDTPTTVSVSYVDEDNDYQNGSQSYRRAIRTSEQHMSVRLDLTLGADEAQCIARRLAFQLGSQEKALACQLPPSYVKAIENDILILNTDDGNSRRMLVQTVDDGKNGLRRYDGVEDLTTTVTFAVVDCTVEAPDFPGQEIYIPPEMALIVLDIAPLLEAHALTPGLYWAGSPYDAEVQFAGAQIVQDPTLDSALFNVDVTDERATMGYTTAALPTIPDPFLVDRVNSLNVRLRFGALENKSLDLVLRGVNRAVVGGEIIGFTTAVLQGDGTWTISGFLRGLQDTDDEVATHAAHEPFLLLNAPGVRRFVRDSVIFGTTHDYQLVPVGGTSANYSVQVQGLTVQLNCLRPFAPMGVKATRDSGTNDITITWLRRTRIPYRTISGNPLPLDEPTLNYEIDVYTAGHSAIVRTILVTNAQITVYTSAQQTADGFSPPLATLALDLFLTNPTVMRSKRERVTLTVKAV